MQPFSLYPYQLEAIEAVNAYMRTMSQGNPCIVLPAGSGKTVVMAEMIKDYTSRWKDTRICILAHTRELVNQNVNKLHAYWPDMPLAQAGVYSAGLKQRDTFNPVIFASIQSVYNKAYQLGRFDLIFVDEAHRIPFKGDGMYRQFIADNKEINSNSRVIGFTATDYRLQGGRVCRPNAILNHACYEANVKDLIDQGYLCPLVSKGSALHIDLTEIPIVNKDYRTADLEATMNQDHLVVGAVKEMIKFCADRKAWVVFCSGIEHAHHVSEELQKHDVYAPAVHSKMPAKERDQHIQAFTNGKLRALINVNVLSEGFDAPQIDAVIMLRPTMSPGMYYQQVGRGLRLHPSKTNCLVLDFANNIVTHGPIDDIHVTTKSGSGPAVMKNCPECQTMVYGGVKECPDCGHEWETVESDMSPDHQAHASGANILTSAESTLERIEVTKIEYEPHFKNGTAILKATYYHGITKLCSEYVCLEHQGFAQKKAQRWWAYRSDTMPSTVEEALLFIDEHGIKAPKTVLIDRNQKYPEILNYGWD